MKHVFIVNPNSGRGNGLKISKVIENFCQEKRVDYKMIYTTKPNEAAYLVKKLGNENIIYSVGGDGTLKEIVNGIIETKNILGIIPAGSGNDFYKTLKMMPKKINKIDLGMANEQYFINIASIGIDALVANNVELMKKYKIPASVLYNASIVYSLLNRVDPTIQIASELKKITLMTICNGRYYGNGIMIAPNANIQDGLFDIYQSDSLKNYQIPSLLYKLFKGTHETSKYIHKSQKSYLKITSENELICNIDGEIIKDKTFIFQNIKQKIEIDNTDSLKLNEYLKKM